MPIDSIDHDGGGWESKDLPDDPREAFRIINAWAKELQAWNLRVRAMCAIVETELDLSPGQFARVVDSVKNHKHSKADIKLALGKGDRDVSSPPLPSDTSPTTGLTGATDVVGHPPDPPFTDTSTKQ